MDDAITDIQKSSNVNHTKCLIEETTCPKLLKEYFYFMNEQIKSGKANKISFSTKLLYEDKSNDINVICDALRISWSIMENSDIELQSITEYLKSNFNNGDNEQELFRMSKLLYEVLSFCNISDKGKMYVNDFSDKLVNWILRILNKNLNTSVRHHIISNILPCYYNISDEKLTLVNILFEDCKSSHHLDVLCALFSYIDQQFVINKNSILHNYQYWLFIERCISGEESYLQKQATYLLFKAINFIYSCDNTDNVPILVRTKQNFNPQKIWNDFFILLDVSREKQLHLIQPSLCFLNSIKYLDDLWQLCIYKILLKHTQQSVVYLVATVILKQNFELNTFKTIFKYLLPSINKNEYSEVSNKMFNFLRIFVSNLHQTEFLMLLDESLLVTWNPLAIWCYLKAVFSKNNTNRLPLTYFEIFWKYINALPHVFVREALLIVLIRFYKQNYDDDLNESLDDLLKVLCLLEEYNKDMFIQSTNELFKSKEKFFTPSAAVYDNMNLRRFNLYLLCIKILNIENVIDEICKSSKNLNTNKLIVVYKNFSYKFDLSTITMFIMDNLRNNNEESVEHFLNLVDAVFDKNSIPELYSAASQILLDSSTESNTNQNIAFAIVNKYNNLDSKEIIFVWKNKFKNNRNKFNNEICRNFIKFYCSNTFKNTNVSDNELEEVLIIFEDILESQNDEIITVIFSKISNVIQSTKNYTLIKKFIKTCTTILLKSNKSKYFKAIVEVYINNVYTKKFVEEAKYFDLFNEINKSLVELSQTFYIVGYYLSKKINHLIIGQILINQNFLQKCVPVICTLLLQGALVSKDERTEYNVCQDIEKFGVTDLESSPNIRKLNTRLFALESIIHLINNHQNYADDFCSHLMTTYMMYYNKRYFPDSQIHFQKLRIVQCLLILHPFIKHKKEELIDLIMDSFCAEIHQTCVKQLMQWLLICLLKNDNDVFLQNVIKKIETTNKTQPSTIVAFLPVLYHLTVSKPEEFWSSAMEAMLPWCMGAHFKLRVYSQAAVIRLFEEARRKKYTQFLSKYTFIESTIKPVIEASGQSFIDTLKTDKDFFDHFKPEMHYSIESIYTDIPKLNKVSHTEWENISKYKFSEYQSIKIFNDDKTFSNIIINETKTIDEDLCLLESSSNIQKKITPWKDFMEETDSDTKSGDFIVIASLVDKSTNLGGISRTCEVFGVKQLIMNDGKIIKDKEFKSLSMSSENWVDITEVKFNDLKEFIKKIKRKGYSVIGAEQTSESVKLNEHKFDKKTALLLGHEKEGIPADVIPFLDACVEIPQLGMVRSLNVHVAGAIFIWEYAKQHLI